MGSSALCARVQTLQLRGMGAAPWGRDGNRTMAGSAGSPRSLSDIPEETLCSTGALTRYPLTSHPLDYTHGDVQAWNHPVSHSEQIRSGFKPRSGHPQTPWSFLTLSLPPRDTRKWEDPTRRIRKRLHDTGLQLTAAPGGPFSHPNPWRSAPGHRLSTAHCPCSLVSVKAFAFAIRHGSPNR